MRKIRKIVNAMCVWGLLANSCNGFLYSSNAINMDKIFAQTTVEEETSISGSFCSDIWKYNPDTKTLTITGEYSLGAYYGDKPEDERYYKSSKYKTTGWEAYVNDIENIVVTDQIGFVGERIFKNCTNVKNIILGDEVRYIDVNAFPDSDKVESIQIGEGMRWFNLTLPSYEHLKEIKVSDKNNNLALSGNDLVSKDGKTLYLSDIGNMKNFYISENIEKLAPNAINGGFSYTSIEVDSKNKYFTEVNGALYNKDMTYLLRLLPSVSGTFTFPEKTTQVLDLKEYDLDEDNLYLSPFIDCDKITEIHLGKAYNGDVSKLGYLTSLKKITVSNSNPKYKAVKNVLTSKNGKVLKMYPSGYKTLKLPNSISELGKNSISYNPNITKLTLSDSMTSFSCEAVYKCPNLTTIQFGKKVKTFYNSYCSYITSPNFNNYIVPSANKYFKAKDGVLYNKKMTKLIDCPIKRTSYKFPDTVTSVSKNAISKTKWEEDFEGPNFKACFSNLKELTLNNTMKKVPSIPETIETLNFGNKINKLGGQGIAKHINIPKGNKYFAAKDNCIYSKDYSTLYAILEGTTSITLPGNLKKCAWDFNRYNRTTIETLNTGDDITTVPEALVKLKLDNLIIGKNVRKMFDDTEVSIDNSSDATENILKIEDNSIDMEEEEYSTYILPKKITLSDENKNFKLVNGLLYSGDGKILYLSERGLCGDVKLLDSTKRIMKNAFVYSELSSIQLPEGLERIDEYVFRNCPNLEEVTIPKSVRTIRTFMYGDFPSLKTVKLQSDKIVRGGGCFWNYILFLDEVNDGCTVYLKENAVENDEILKKLFWRPKITIKTY